MGVSSTARLPSLGAQSISQLFSHLQVSSNAKVLSRWSITIRSFRAVPVPTNVWPSDNSANTNNSNDHNQSSASTGPASLTKARTMWQIWISDYPGIVFIIVEDAGKASRAKVWRDWESAVRSHKVQESQQTTNKPLQEEGVDAAAPATSAMEIDAEPETKPDSQAIPDLKVPSHTRFTVTAVTSTMSSMLTSLNLPPPHGAPVGTAGPGAWVPRGAAVSIEGLVLEVSSQNMNGVGGLLGAAPDTEADTASTGRADWRIRVGSVVGGGGRSAGAVVEAEFLPMSGLLPTSTYLHSFLQSLFPPNMVNVSTNGSASAPVLQGTQTVGATSGSATPALAASGNMSSFSYLIGPNIKMVGTTPNSMFNIPILSDQLWEEIVPRSNTTWRNMILARSKQSTNEVKSSATSQKTGESPFEWHSFGSDAGQDEPPNQSAQDTINGNPSAVEASITANDSAVDTNTIDTELVFEGLRSDYTLKDETGWTGIERGRRVAFHYVQMLRAEGII